MRIVPAIDIIDGKCVRLNQGDYSTQKVYNHNPLDLALELEAIGFKYLHLVDLDGALSSRPLNLLSLNQIAIETKFLVDFGGGIKSEDSLIQVFRSGANQANVGSLAAKNPTLVKFWVKKYGAEKIIIGTDVRARKIAVNGWTETTEIDILEFITDYYEFGARHFICTDISKDGMMGGSAVELYSEILNHFPDIELTASGGVSTIEEIKHLESIGLKAAIVGKAIYEGHIDPMELIKEFNQ